MNNSNTSILIERQLPEFVREEYPKFISFLEAYYEFLEQKQIVNNTDQKNDLTVVAKKLRNLSDVDESLDEFENNFFNSFLPFIPKNSALNKDILIKNIMPLYLSKGSEKSYKLLFRMLFDTDVQFEYPGRNVLRASDGRWIKENIYRVETTVYSEYTSDGIKSLYFLPYEMDRSDFYIEVNGTLNNSYSFRKETRKIIFQTIPPINSKIRVYYTDFNISILKNRKITGSVSGAYSLVENASKRSIGGSTYFQFNINEQKIFGIFKTGEPIISDYVIDEETIPFTFFSFSDLQSIQILDGGSRYNIGDSVIIRGESTRRAIAIIDDVASGVIEKIIVLDGGAGFQLENKIYADGINSAFFEAEVQTIDRSGIFSANSLPYNIDFIENYANVSIDSLDYDFPDGANRNVESISIISSGNLAVGFPNIEILGSNTQQAFASVSNVKVTNVFISNSGIGYANNEILTVTGGTGISANLRIDNVDSNGNVLVISIDESGSYSELPVINLNPFTTNTSINGIGFTANIRFGIDQISIDNPGNNYKNASVFVIATGNNISNAVLSVNLSEAYENVNTVIEYAFSSNTLLNIGPITSVNVLVSKIDSSVNPIFQANSTILYNDTNLLQLGIIGKLNIDEGGQDYEVGDVIKFNNTPLWFGGQGANAFVSNVSTSGAITEIKIVDGGLSYNKNAFPTIEVISSNGSNAVLTVNCLMGDGEILEDALVDGLPGEIRSIKILESGFGYTVLPAIDLTQSGDGTALALANLSNSIITFEGRWKTTDSILSSDEVRLQGRDYYIDFSYVLKTQVEFDKYKSLLKKILHPSGLVNYSKYPINDVIEFNLISEESNSYIEKTVSGTVTITNNSNTIVGTNTNFVLANTLNILTTNSVIAIENDVRIVISIEDETTLIANNVFTSNSTNSIIKILT
jgi:hypothetical protein